MKKGITLIALVISIVVMLILAGVSVNAIFGENGIIEQLMNARFMTALSDLVFDLESEIVDINIRNRDRKLTSVETLHALYTSGVLTSLNNDAYNLINGTISNDYLGDVSIGYNGDVWIDNYKRAKIQLTTQTDEAKCYYQMGNSIYNSIYNTTMTVVNGKIITGENSNVCICSLDDRPDFALWVNQYGEVVSTVSNIYANCVYGLDLEYTALYEDLDYLAKDGTDYGSFTNALFVLSNYWQDGYWESTSLTSYAYYDETTGMCYFTVSAYWYDIEKEIRKIMTIDREYSTSYLTRGADISGVYLCLYGNLDDAINKKNGGCYFYAINSKDIRDASEDDEDYKTFCIRCGDTYEYLSSIFDSESLYYRMAIVYRIVNEDGEYVDENGNLNSSARYIQWENTIKYIDI